MNQKTTTPDNLDDAKKAAIQWLTEKIEHTENQIDALEDQLAKTAGWIEKYPQLETFIQVWIDRGEMLLKRLEARLQRLQDKLDDILLTEMIEM